ncbi:MAG TPA: hypothetical protein VLN90_00920 [Thioalkalivibrio sp.]|nr:hypothetical protein [Thioalkalivibrio sp.]
MAALLKHEARRMFAKALPWGLFLVMAAFTLFFYWDYASQAAVGPLENLMADQPDLTTYRPSPQYMEDYDSTVALLGEASERNLADGSNSVILEGSAGLDYRLFQLTQSGLLILSSLALGLISSDFSESPTGRRIGSTRILTARSAVVVLSAALILLAPKLMAVGLAQLLHGGISLERMVPFNPKAGPALYHYLDATYFGSSEQRLILAQSLTSLRQIFLRAMLYELLQIFAWTSLGLMLGRLFIRKFPAMVLTAFFLFMAKSFSLPLDQFPPASFFFLIYQDALRDTLGSPDMIHGMVSSVYPQDYGLGLSVLLVSGVFFLYLADLQLKGRLRRKLRGGDDDEAI